MIVDKWQLMVKSKKKMKVTKEKNWWQMMKTKMKRSTKRMMERLEK